MAVLKYCARCGGLVNQSHKHRKKDGRPSARRRGYDAKWEQTRRDFLGAFPACQWPEGCLTPASQVHHLDGEGPMGVRGHDFGNLQSLCASHHAQITAKEKPSGWNAPRYQRSYEEE